MQNQAKIPTEALLPGKRVSKERHFRHALHMVQLGYWWWDPATNDLEWSDECFHMLGMDPSRDQAAMETYVNTIHPDDRDRVQLNMESVFQTGQAPDMQYRIVRPDSSMIHVYTRAEMVHDETGRPLYLFGTLQDITRQKQQEEDLEHAIQAAERASLAKSAFLSRMSHEFFTPLNAVVGFGHILSEMPELQPETGQMVQEITQAGSRLTALVKDILAYTHLESAAIDPQEIDLAIFMQDIRDSHARLVEHHGQKLDLAPVADLILNTDPSHLKGILNQLIDNAIKYNQPNGRVAIGAEREGKNKLRLWVQDSGCGIYPDFRTKIFKPFERQPHHDNLIEGSGLGLSICRRVSKLLKGEMGYSSRENKGSRFWIELPINTQ